MHILRIARGYVGTFGKHLAATIFHGNRNSRRTGNVEALAAHIRERDRESAYAPEFFLWLTHHSYCPCCCRRHMTRGERAGDGRPADIAW